MTNETKKKTENQESNGNANQPTHIAKMRNGYGNRATYERIGVAWVNEDGSLYVKLHGTQIVDRGFTLYENETNEKAGE